ncbi:MAG: manganese-dependent inorganic pyrophosphatase [Paracoccaceae bacterium]|nr:manganese-dependent inorganic pyrophosphatase [Paracoccaceae bacterium]MDE2911649.1 manganese-dependent inorganic pyrophosphatase [Paracoccaceae bacterium]
MIRVFGHKAPDADATGSAVIWSWYLNAVKGLDARPFVLDEPNNEARFVLDRWNTAVPAILDGVRPGDDLVVVDTNNPDELPDGINDANVIAVIDHHLIAGGLRTRQPIEFIVRPVAATATVMAGLIGDHLDRAPDDIKGIMLSCILSDTLAFRSPTTTPEDEVLAKRLARDLGIGIDEYAETLFAAKSDMSHLTDTELLRLDSKIYGFPSGRFRVTVLETVSPAVPLARKEALMAGMEDVARADGVDEVLVFVIDILRQEATLLVPNDAVRSIARTAFQVVADGDSVRLPGIVSRKKQIVPALQG